MIKKVFRPFWSYDVQKTEAWLTEMGEKGYQFVGFNRHTRQFFFKEEQPSRKIYEICYDSKGNGELPSSLKEDGWEKVVQKKKWYVMVNEKTKEEINTFSNREGIMKRNRISYFIFIGILGLFGLNILNLSFIFGVIYFSNEPFEITVEESPLWFITYSFYALGIILIMISIYSVVKISKTNKRLDSLGLKSHSNDENQFVEYNRPVNKQQEKEWKKEGKLVKRRKLNWMYAPDKLEKWLENMEEQGYNLYRVNQTGTVFYFLLGKPRKISYCTEYQNVSKVSSEIIHRDSGWNHVFSTKYSIQKWNIWSKEYNEAEEKPQLYSDGEMHLKQARRIAATYTFMFLPLVLIYVFITKTNIELYLRDDNGTTPIEIFNLIVFPIIIILFGSYFIRTLLYYRRLKKQYQ
ncbi:DUF2812 domain-containing protein [Evansella sp. AB-P1]|uniref:DUF2812 domain-containing protein n=1 Tax=Evansella sp. AB-P1 TaxID=3037653 RepID=UPI00241F8871|nr:DUF2812 domain-containing protein [Evansella sp. AB-P1]MDG5788966.1 DUF2812 domain-containing protein [Evansella sp. AB-P1]